MPDIIRDLSAATLRLDGMADEIEDYGAVMSHVHYGRGWPISDEETIANVLVSFRHAERAWGTVYLVFDGEDTGFGGEGCQMERMFDAPVEDDTHALLAWWESYGFASGEEAEPLRRKIAELAEIDYRHLLDPQ
jgi:hypothetical protein